MRIIDISREILSSPVYPGDVVPRLERKMSIADGYDFNYSAVTMGLHSGTHIDAPLHFIEDGGDAASISNEAFVGNCTVLETPAGALTASYVEHFFPAKCSRLLLKTGTSPKPRPQNTLESILQSSHAPNEEMVIEGGEFTTFTPDGAEELARRGLRLIGTESLSIAPAGTERKSHLPFLRRNIVILEGLDLSNVTAGRYFLVAAPLKIAGAEGAPARALLLLEN
ncbi:MAG: cyclase family protein [Oscillospiraceae bacterium]|nr:cyclase family protein [Oscillospiraceae bacterium]